MITYLRGRLQERDEQGCTIEVAGIGYRLTMATQSVISIGDVGNEVTVYTLLQIRDDIPVFFGFATREERALFEKLVSVSGVGPKVALSALSTFIPAELARAIAEGDITRIATVPGIGKKTAQRIVLELKGILELQDEERRGGANVGANDGANSKIDAGYKETHKETTDALLNMGFTMSEIQAALKGYDGKNTDALALLRYALKRLGG